MLSKIATSSYAEILGMTNLQAYEKAVTYCPDHPSGQNWYWWDGSAWNADPGSTFDNLQRFYIWPGAGSVLTSLGIAVITTGSTVSHPTQAAGSALNELSRVLLTSGATAGSIASLRSANMRIWRGNAAGKGGFKVSQLFALGVQQAGQRVFAGISANAAAPTNVDPLTDTANSKFGIAINQNTGTWNLINNLSGAAPTVLNLGANFPVDTTTLYDLQWISPPNGSAILYRIVNKTNGAIASGSLTSNIPNNTTFMAPYYWMTNNATAAAVSFVLGRCNAEFG